MIRVVIVGDGAVAESLTREIVAAKEIEFAGQWARKTHVPEELPSADLYILAVSDPAITEISGQLPFAAGSVVAHTAGSVAMETLSPRIAHRGVIYPLQTFTRGRRTDDFRRIPFFIEGETPHALTTVRIVADAISDSVTELSSPRRALLHLAAAFANNFSNAMFSVAEQIAAEAGIPFDSLKPLIAETAAKALAMPSPRMAQTGPAQRGDTATRQKHLAMLEAIGRPDLTELYRNVSEQIWKISKKN